MKCKHCGEEIANDSKFCEFCGKEQANKDELIMFEILDRTTACFEPMAAYIARQSCYLLCRQEHPNDYKEYVKNFIAKNRPKVSERCKLDVKYKIWLVIMLLLFLFFLIIAICDESEILLISLAFLIPIPFRKRLYRRKLSKLYKK